MKCCFVRGSALGVPRPFVAEGEVALVVVHRFTHLLSALSNDFTLSSVPSFPVCLLTLGAAIMIPPVLSALKHFVVQSVRMVAALPAAQNLSLRCSGQQATCQEW